MQHDLPTGWSVRPLEKVATLQRGFDLPIQVREEGVIPVYGSNGIDGWHGHSAVSGPGVITGRSGTIGSVYLEPGDYWPLNTTLYVRDFHSNDPRFIARMLESLDLKRFAASTGVPSLNRNFVHPTPVFLPPLDEQSRIAVVLDTVDEAIAKTEGMIAKLKQVHAGLLHDLLTRGLDEYGQLRDPIAHPEQFQDSSVGRIPRKWRVCGVLDVAPSERQAILTGPFGAQLGQADFVREGIPVLRIGNVQSGCIDLSDLQFVTEEKAQTLERFRIKYGDLLFARQGATTGRNALADERVEGYIINYHIIRVAVNRDSCSPVFLQALFNSENVRRQINRDKGRGTREGINTGEITALRFALPSIEEQHHAVSVICAQSQLVEAEVELLGKLHLIKAGLISDLLTGRVRVPESISVVENQP